MSSLTKDPLTKDPLTRAWALLVFLTLVAMWAGTAQTRLAPFAVQAAIVAAVAGLKASTILRYFLGLRSASSGWRTLFSVYLVLLCGAIFAIYAVGEAVGPRQSPHISSGRAP